MSKPNIDEMLNSLTPEAKKELFKSMLREKAAKSANASNTEASINKELSVHNNLKNESIPAEYRKVELFPEYHAFFGQFDLMKQFQLQNPFFLINEGIVTNTTNIEGREMISYASYNYLGLSGDIRVSKKAKLAIEQYGTSVSASRPVTGEKPLHQELEDSLADFLGVEACLVFVSGHATNVTTIGHLFRPQDLILYDSLSHNSILQGCKLSGAKMLPFPHNDWNMLHHILENERKKNERVLIVIEGVYSMDGDIADLPKYIELRNKYGTFLMVDEAHSMGVLGKTGRGIGEYFDVNRGDVDLWMGTLSKALASCGGYIGGSKELINYLKYTVPGFLYSVGITPPNTGAALAALHILKAEPERVEQLGKNARLFLELVKKAGFNTGISQNTAIVPVIIGDSIKCVRLANLLFNNGINVQPILFPAVSEDAARLRFFLTSLHTEEQIRFTVDTLTNCFKEIAEL